MAGLHRDPLHKQLVRILSEEIVSGRLPRGSVLPSEADLCRQYGISRSTVRQTLAGLAREGLVRTEAGRGTFVVGLAPQPETPPGPGVGLVVPQLSGLLLARVLEGAQEELARAGHALLVETSAFQPGGEERAVRGLRQRGVAGALVVPSAACATPPDFYQETADEGFPVVFVDRHRTDGTVPWVASDNVGGGRELARHLVRLGHRRLAYVLSRDFPATSLQDRVRGAEWAVAEAGLEPGALQSAHVGGGMHEPLELWIHRAVADLMAAPATRRPTAILCANDDIAMEALAGLRRLGASVPGDVALVGFDDLPYARFLDPPLTTARQDARGLGRAAARLLLRMVDRPGAFAPELLPVDIRIRQSTLGGAAPQGAPVELAGARRGVHGRDA